MSSISASAPTPTKAKTWLGHPRGLATLFFTEMWERFSYYGMRALLVLFMTGALVAQNPGLGFQVNNATALYGIYTAMVYFTALPGGWVADKLWGHRKTVFVGGCIIAAGHFSLAGPLVGLPDLPTFFLGLVLIIIGTGLLKPNVSTMVGQLYPSAEEGDTAEQRAAAEQWGAKRDAGFSIYYMGINLGAILGPFICGTLGEKVNWHWGFSAAGFGMVLGLVQYRLGYRYLHSVGKFETADDAAVVSRRARIFYLSALAVGVVLGVLVLLAVLGVLGVSFVQVATWLGYLIVAFAVIYFAYLYFGGGYGKQEKRRIIVICWLFLLAAIFWAGFEQAGSSLNLFAEGLTNRMIFGWEMPATWLQNVNPIFIVIFAPIFGVLWTTLAAQHRNPSIPTKFALGLLGLSAGFFVIAWGASYATEANPVSPAWLVVTYFLFTVGELCLSPVGLSSMTKLAPRDRVGQMMGIWFTAAALGNLIAGLLAGTLEGRSPSSLFLFVAIFVGAFGVLALLVRRGVQRLTGGID
ncbi:MAG: peptide MFS transporter [Propionibacteriaceae bacterium]|jgi:POT family proton-dependent oligopeptide transporter